jgi:hypothetical protein
VKQKEIVMRGAELGFALLAGGPVDGLDAFDAERLDDGFGGHAKRLLDGWRLLFTQPSQQSSIGVTPRGHIQRGNRAGRIG